MAILTAPKERIIINRDHSYFMAFPVMENQDIFEGSFVVFDFVGGGARAGNFSATVAPFIGVAVETKLAIANPTLNDTVKCELGQIETFEGAAISSNAQVGILVQINDDDTVNLNSSTYRTIGAIRRVEVAGFAQILISGASWG